MRQILRGQVDMRSSFGDSYRGKKVFVSGHTGFKGTWLCQWLHELGASVVGYSRDPNTHPNHFGCLDTSNWNSVIGDVRDWERFADTLLATQPEVVFHLAAQPLVRRSYQDPVDTFQSNVTGTLNLLEACRSCPSIRAIVVITSDKVYDNVESQSGYSETSRLGGADPYSCSKACCELVVSCYRRSYFDRTHGHAALLASARAGNVIGGGDWSEDRLIPDAVRAATGSSRLVLRNPQSVRPWQHVLEPLSGYLLIGQRLLEGDAPTAAAWNFGPQAESHVPVQKVVEAFQDYWPQLEYAVAASVDGPRETSALRLDSTLAQDRLGWRPVLGWTEATEWTARWYREYIDRQLVVTQVQLEEYVELAARQGSIWA